MTWYKILFISCLNFLALVRATSDCWSDLKGSKEKFSSQQTLTGDVCGLLLCSKLEDAREGQQVVYSAVKRGIKWVNYARNNTVCHWAGPTLYSFHIQMSKKRRRGCRRVYRSKSRESWCQHERGWKECRWEVQAAHRCQPALCLRANGGVTLTRQGRGVQTSSCTTGAAVTLSAPSLPRLPSLFMPCIAGRTHGDGHDWGDGRSDLAWFKSWYFALWKCKSVLK